jgi:hypothetical protein
MHVVCYKYVFYPGKVLYVVRYKYAIHNCMVSVWYTYTAVQLPFRKRYAFDKLNDKKTTCYILYFYYKP